MSESEFNKLFSNNLNYFMNLHGMNQVDIAKHLGVNKSSVSSWCNGNKIPRMAKIDELCKLFSINRSDLIERKSYENTQSNHSHNLSKESNGYYLTDDTIKMAQEIKDNKELSLLFDAAKDVSDEDLKFVHDMLLRMKRKERD